MKKFWIKFVKITGAIILLLCLSLYFFQEKLIFFPKQISADCPFDFPGNFEEYRITMADGKKLHGLLFKADSSKGLLFYLHGNAGSIGSWGRVASTYTDLHYDVFMPDYRGFGKSEGRISSEDQLFQDMQLAYKTMLKHYSEEKIIVLGYSIGTGPATYIASVNHPSLLILQAPFFNLTDMMEKRYPFLPVGMLRYPMTTNLYLPKCKMPVVIFHGNTDHVIDYSESLKLQKLFKAGDTLITLQGQGHLGMTDNADYRMALEAVLKK